MKPIPALMMYLIAASTASYAAERIDLQERGATQERGQAPTPPHPPTPPVPPSPPGPASDAIAPQPPQPPLHPSMSTAQLPPLPLVPPTPPQPSIPAPPAPPAPPPKPVVPKAAHHACVGKSVDAPVSYKVRKGAVMRGTCQMDSRGMYFDLTVMIDLFSRKVVGWAMEPSMPAKP